MPSRNRLEITLSPEQLETLTIEAERNGTTKAALIRLWAFEGVQSTPVVPKGPQVYANAVEAAARAYPGLPRTQLEAIVSAVIVSLHNG